LAGAACSDNSGNGDPNDAAIAVTPIIEDTTFPEQSDGAEQRLETLSCADGVLTVATTGRTIRATLPCDRLPPPEVVDRFRDQPVEIEARVEQPAAKVFLRSDVAGSLEFTVGAVTVEER
jgi:hypothetical protein